MTTGIDDAVDLMQRALTLLDAAGENLAASHLQGAIDAVHREQAMQLEDAQDAACASLIEDRLCRQLQR